MSRAILLDEQEERLESEEEITNEEIETFAEDPVEETLEQEEEVPEKYKNKSIKDLVKMHQEAEKLLGRHSSEVGDLRKVVDQYIQTQLHAQQQAQQSSLQQEEAVDFFVEPDKAVNNAIDNHPAIKQAKEYTEQARKAAALSLVKNKHPDMETIVQDPGFASWIQASKIRTQLFFMADQKFDVDAADELFSLWKERQQTVQNTATVEKAARKEALKAANTGNARGSLEQRSKKKFRRADIIRLMNSDPQRYEALQGEIMQAYAEGRII